MMKKHANTFQWDGPSGYRMAITVCAEELCELPHVMIYDEDNKPLAAMVVPPAALAIFKAWGDEAEVAKIQREILGRRAS